VFRQFDFHARARPSLYLLDIGRKIRPLTAEELKVLGPRYPYIPPQIDYGAHRPDPPADLVLPEGVKHDIDHTGLPCPACVAIEGAQTELGASIVAVANALDNITAHSPHHATRPLRDACIELEKGSGTKFNPHIVTAFLKHSDEIFCSPPFPF
jgi:hypothetical protein